LCYLLVGNDFVVVVDDEDDDDNGLQDSLINSQMKFANDRKNPRAPSCDPDSLSKLNQLNKCSSLSQSHTSYSLLECHM